MTVRRPVVPSGASSLAVEPAIAVNIDFPCADIRDPAVANAIATVTRAGLGFGIDATTVSQTADASPGYKTRPILRM
jgi:hypothetical protein